MVGISTAGPLGPLLVCRLDSSSTVEAEFLISALQGLGDISPVFVGADNLLNTSRFTGCSILLVVGWEAQDHAGQLIEDFRELYPNKPIVVFSNKNDPRIRTKAFVKGTDNYISPDCSEAEIRAKVRRLWRLAQIGEQTSGMRDAPIRVRGLEIWLNEMVVLQNGQPVQLSPRELAMLIFLAKQHPQSVSRQTLEREVFGFRGDPGTNVVAVHVHRLRRKISPDGAILRTIPGGYQLS